MIEGGTLWHISVKGALASFMHGGNEEFREREISFKKNFHASFMLFTNDVAWAEELFTDWLDCARDERSFCYYCVLRVVCVLL